MEESEDKISSLRHSIAGDVVMLSHLAMKLFYVQTDTENLSCENQSLINKISDLKTRIIQLKNENLDLVCEKNILCEQAGMITNTSLLGDFKETFNKVDKMSVSNEKKSSKILFL